LVLSMVGGTIGFLVGELILANYQDQWPQWLLMGIYFGQYALFVGLGCLIAEMISPRLNGLGWRQRYLGFSWKMLVPSTLVMLFIAGSLFQLLYGLGFGGAKPSSANDVVMLLDVSDSMRQTDPDRQLFKAAADLIRKMDGDKRVAVIVFNDQAGVLQPLVPVNDQAIKERMIQLLNEYNSPSGGTNIEAALKTAMDHLQQAQSEGSMLILMSDGYSDVDLDTALAPYKQERIAVNTVGMNGVETKATDLLKSVATQTEGHYFSVEHADQLSSAFTQIYLLNQRDQHLVGERLGQAHDSTLYVALRIMLMTAIGTLVGLSLGLVFDNKFLAKSFSIGGTVAGLLGGLLLEFGLGHPLLPNAVVRLFADVAMALVLSVFTAVIPVQERSAAAQGSFSKGRFTSAKPFPNKKVSSNRFDM
ncbi:MAG: vWA domain-containing protein, partial [Clostridia bacterium]